MSQRPLSDDEKRLFIALVNRSNHPENLMRFVDQVVVENMNDGGMGSIKLFVISNPDASRKMKSQVSELQFYDADGVIVIASLYMSEDGLPFEIDVWKTTFDPLIRIPQEFSDVIYGDISD
jgi:hypothetical protein